MKNFHLLSFGLGLASGLLFLFAVVGIMRWASPSSPASAFQQGGGFTLSRMAERLGMTEDELNKELKSGKTFQQVASEKGVSLSFGGGRRSGSASGSTVSGSGTSVSR